MKDRSGELEDDQGQPPRRMILPRVLIYIPNSYPNTTLCPQQTPVTMASGLVFNPQTLLHVIPLATSTGTLAHAILEHAAFSSFLVPSIRQSSDKILPTWFDRVFKRAVCTVLALNLSTIGSAAATLFLNRYYPSRRPLQTSAFYWVGLVGAVGHLAFVPFVAGPVQRIVEDTAVQEDAGESGIGATGDMARWLSVHRVRMAVVDLPAWIAFVGAILTS